MEVSEQKVTGMWAHSPERREEAKVMDGFRRVALEAPDAITTRCPIPSSARSFSQRSRVAVTQT